MCAWPRAQHRPQGQAQPSAHPDVSGRPYKGSNCNGSQHCAKKLQLSWSITASPHPTAPSCPSCSPAHPRLSLGRDSFGFQSLFRNDGCFFPCMDETNVFPQKMGTRTKPPFPKGIFFFFLMKKQKSQPVQSVGMGSAVPELPSALTG